MSNLEVVRQLANLYRTVALSRVHETIPSICVAYETMADELHQATMGIARGNDPTVEVEYLRDSWMLQARFADGHAVGLFTMWAGVLSSEVLV